MQTTLELFTSQDIGSSFYPMVSIPHRKFLRFIESKLGHIPQSVEEEIENLLAYKPPSFAVEAWPQERKWELVSAYQKAIRYGHAHIAHTAAARLIAMGQEPLEYLWKRIVVTAGEDIGLGDRNLTLLVLLCNEFFKASKFQALQSKVIHFITSKLAVTLKDRTLCDFAIISDWMLKVDVESPELQELAAATQKCEMLYRKAGARKDFSVYADEYGISGSELGYMVSQNWRTQGMTRYIGLVEKLRSEQFEIEAGGAEQPHIQHAPTIQGLPAYAYDMHTRIGKRALERFSEHPAIRPFLSSDSLDAFGYGLFYVESGMLDKRLTYDKRDFIEKASQQFALTAQGIKAQEIDEFLAIIKANLPTLNEIRATVANKVYGKN